MPGQTLPQAIAVLPWLWGGHGFRWGSIMRKHRKRGGSVKTGLLAFLGWLAVSVLCRTLRLRVHDPEGWVRGHRRREKKIWACWHGQQLIGFYFFRGRGTGILSSLSRDGDYSSRIMRFFGWRIVRGSSSKGAVSGLLALLRCVKSGGEIAITPDGPRGPAYHIEPGALFLAAKTGAPIVPFAFAARPAWTAPSWDRFLVPWPFARCVAFFGHPYWVRDEVNEENLPILQASLAEAINQANREAENALFCWR